MGAQFREVTELDYSDNRSSSSTLFTADGFDEEHKGKIVIRDGKEIIVQPKKMPTSTSGPDFLWFISSFSRISPRDRGGGEEKPKISPKKRKNIVIKT